VSVERVRRMVIKVGTATIAEGSGRISSERIRTLVGQIAEARLRGIDVALVSSGAIASGTEKLGLERRPGDIQALQAVSAVGQGLLMQMYAGLFADSGITTGQVLLTRFDMTHRQQYLNARHTFEHLFEMGVVPVINENDTVATEEITFGENDILAALVAALVGADLLVLLTDTRGLYTADPSTEGGARLLERVERITEEIEGFGGDAGSRLASGGMSSKVQAVKTAIASGVSSVIADGRSQNIIVDILDGKQVGTYFPAAGKELRSKKHWIGYAMQSRGRLVIAAGAARAVRNNGKSLLPVGVLSVDGDFQAGDAVDIVDPDGVIIGRGLVNYGCLEAARIKGLRSTQVAELLGETAEEIIHRDCLVVFEDSDDTD